MTNLKKQKSLQIIVLFLAILASGCAGPVKHMATVSNENAVTTPDKGKALIVFQRPSKLGYAIQSSVFEIVDDEPEILGVIAAKKKMAYQADPGEHLFMVVSESADFMSAEVEADKVYYVLVAPRMGAWKARFSLGPILGKDVDGPKNQEWLKSCEWVEKTSSADEWASKNMADIKEKHKAYYEKWMSKPEADRPRLTLEDGQSVD